MWKVDPQGFAECHGLTLRQSRLLQATGEHLIPYSLSGPASKKNIAAACVYCNQGRHKNGGHRAVEAYRHHVQKRMNSGKWYPFDVIHIRRSL
jgi:5-methylcytosine-specific restriction endonuclease McrA